MGIMFTGQNHQCFNRLLCNFKVRKQIAAENLCFYEIVLIMVDGTLAKVSRNHEANAEVLLPHKVAKTESRWCEVGLCSRILSTLKGTMSVGEEEREKKEERPRHCRPWTVIDGAGRYLLTLLRTIEQFIISVCFSLTLYATYSVIFIHSGGEKHSLFFFLVCAVAVEVSVTPPTADGFW